MNSTDGKAVKPHLCSYGACKVQNCPNNPKGVTK